MHISQLARGVMGMPWAALKKFFGDGCPSMAAALAFYTMFSLPALLTILLMLVGQFVDPEDVQRLLVGQIQGLVGPAAASQIETVISFARESGVDPSLTALFGLLALTFGATTAFAQLQTGLNKTWHVKRDPRRGDIRNFLGKRVLSFGVVMIVAFLLLVSLALTATIGALSGRLASMLGVGDTALVVANALLSFAVVALLFAAMFKLLPDARVGWRDVLLGGTVTAVLFVGGKELIGFYLGRSDPGTAYGAAGSLALVLVWVYYTSMIVLYGAEVTALWARQFGGGIAPERGAIEVIEVEREVRS